MSGAAFKVWLRADLKTAIQARAADEVRVLRTLVAALDNAEAVPIDTVSNAPRLFGDASGEVARRAIDVDAVDALLQGEIEERLAAALAYDESQPDGAARLRAEAALIARYRKS